MPIHLVELPGAVTLVPGKTLDGQLRRQASNPHVPVDLRALIDYLNGRTDGVPAALDEPRSGSTDKSMVLFGPSYVVRLFPTRRRDGYTIAGIYPLRIADHRRLADRYLRVRPPLWRSVHEPRQIPTHSDAHWPRLDAEWTRLLAAHSTAHGVPTPTARSTRLLETLDRLIDATERIDSEKTRAAPPFPYRDVSATGERRQGTRAVYRFHLAGGRTPQEGTFVQLRGGSERRGQVVRVVAEGGHEVATVRFDEPVAWDDLVPQGELEVTPTNVVYRKQREAVARLRTGQEANAALLPVLTERRVQPFRAADTRPAEPLDPDQLTAYQKALTVPDLLIVLGPPGTGKTRTISEIVRSSAIAAPPQRILVTSHTHRAVDNVLARLPRELVIVRVGHENSVTAEGKPYLLDRQIADLRGEILGRTANAPDACTDPENAAPWADQLSLCVDELATLTEQAARARADLDVKRRAVGGPARDAAVAWTDRLALARDAAEGHRGHIETRVRRHDKVASRAGMPMLGGLFARRARRLRARLDALFVRAAELDAVVADARAELDVAERAALAEADAAPTVRAAVAVLAATRQERQAAHDGARVAARETCAALGPAEGLTPPYDPTDPDPSGRRLGELCAWLHAHMPLIAARAHLREQWHEAVSGETDQLHPELIRYADVIAATCIGVASRPELAELDFDLAIVDEAGQIGVADVLVPLVRAKRGVLVGDERQLPPFLDTDVERWGADADEETRDLLAKSALELLLAGLPRSHVVQLTRQRRMPAEVCGFISERFYGGNLHTAAVHHEHRDPLFTAPMVFVDTARLPPGRRYEQSGGTAEDGNIPGSSNATEGELLVELACFYHRRGAEWAIIVPYRAQVDLITRALAGRIGDLDVARHNVGTVDSFQGGERDVILYGFTRSNPKGNVGFLRELRRINVAFTRVKRQLVLVGDAETIGNADDPEFRKLAEALRVHLVARGEILQYLDVRKRLADFDTDWRRA
ncbi:AAA domain-containing protein [Embleya sp. NPDC005575]|uniref:DEAD/DEAH box helicase n=1 Tax=Embleya sp. NPDC005575 TaxID=3156892 RepID=UPI0033AA48A9